MMVDVDDGERAGRVRRVFMYGGGDDGQRGWPPEMVSDGCVFLERMSGSAGDEPLRDADRLTRLVKQGPVHMVAQSYGGIAAVLAAQRLPELVRSLTLFEPSCADLARESSPVRSFRRSLGPVTRRRDDPTFSDSAYMTAFSEALGEASPSRADDDPALVARLRATPPPWEIAIPRGRLRVPTLVVTGGWSEYFEVIARALVDEGADHRILTGYGHGVVNHPEAAANLLV